MVELLSAGCTDDVSDPRLIAVGKSVDSEPEAALAALKRIDAGKLSDGDRHFHDLMLVKATDKNYDKYESDSLILDVINYYEGKGGPLYAEALYYGGRVYTELGDYPTALDYYQRALDATTDDDIHLRGNITSQTGRLFSDLRMCSYAIPFIQQSLKIDSIERDTFNLAYDYHLLAYTYLISCKLDSAAINMDRAFLYLDNLTKNDSLNFAVLKAGIDISRKEVDKAVNGIRGLPERVEEGTRNMALVYATRIYYEAGIYDTAYYYAKQLRHFPMDKSRKYSYYYLFKPELLPFIEKDSLSEYISDYRETLEVYLSKYDQNTVQFQASHYNYVIHQRERLKAEKSRQNITYAFVISLFCVFCAIIAWLVQKYRSMRQTLDLQNAISRIALLQNDITRLKSELSVTDRFSDDAGEYHIHYRDEIKARLFNSDIQYNVPEKILQSSVISMIREHIEKGKMIGENDVLWEDLENIINENCPQFIETILLLSEGKLTKGDRHILCLIKCNISPTEISILVGKSKGTISSKRNALSIRFFGKNLGNKSFDAIIRKI